MRFSKRISQMDTSDLRNVLALTARPDIISFAGGLPAPEAFPVEALRRAADRVLRTQGPAALQYAPSQGFAPLREKLARRHRAQGISCRGWTWRARSFWSRGTWCCVKTPPIWQP